MTRRIRRNQVPLLLRSLAAGVLVLATTASAAGTGWGGSSHAAFGAAKAGIRKSGKVVFVPNLRFDFDGAAGDAAGTGTMTAYNEAGNLALGSVPFAWEARQGSFEADLDPEGLSSLLAGYVADGVGKEASVVLASASGRGKEGGEEGRIRFAAKGAGTVSLDGGPAVGLKMKIRCR